MLAYIDSIYRYIIWELKKTHENKSALSQIIHQKLPYGLYNKYYSYEKSLDVISCCNNLKRK